MTDKTEAMDNLIAQDADLIETCPKDLVRRLRDLAEEWFEMCNDIHEPLYEAADRIEAQAAEIAILRQPQTDALKIAREAFFRMPEPHEYLNKDQLKPIRPYLDALHNWKHRYGAAFEEQSK